MQQTNDQYLAVAQLERWYRKYTHQVIEISGMIGTGVWDVVQTFIDREGFDPREIMYLSYDQHQVINLATKQYHAYYLDRIIYNYSRIIDFDSLPVVNPRASGVLEYEWQRSVRKKIDRRYRMIVVFDSLLLNARTVRDLMSFGLPIILMRDPMLLPAPDTFTFLRDPNIELREIHPEYIRSPLVYFAHAVACGKPIKPGSYDSVTVIPRKQMNLYNLKVSDMNIASSPELCREINQIYRERILHQKTNINVVGERLLVTKDMYARRIVNSTEKRIKVYLPAGTVGYIRRINKHVPGTKYISMDFQPDFYHGWFEDLYLDRHGLNHINANSRQIVPDEIFEADYAYALEPHQARYNHWDKGFVILDRDTYEDDMLTGQMLYTALTRFKRSITLVI